MKKSIKLLLPFMLFLCIGNTSTAQSDATFEEAIDFVAKHMVKNMTDDGETYEFSLKYLSKFELELTDIHIWEIVDITTSKYLHTWSMSDISEVEIEKSKKYDGYYEVRVSCNPEKYSGGCIETKYISDGILEKNHTFHSIKFIVSGEEMAKRVKKALDHAQKLAAKEEKF
jgi:hypothetical protein